MERLFKALYFAGMAVEIALRIPYDRQRRRIPKTDQRVTATEQGLLGGLSLGLFGLPLIYSLTPWLDGADYPLSPDTKKRMGAVGALFFGAAIWLFWRSHRDLGANWSPSLEIGDQHTLITNGVYRRIRHPMYASQWLWSIGQALLLPNWIAGMAGFVSFVPLYLLRIPREEQMMLDHFGDGYRDYCARTGRVLPRLRD